MIHIPYIGIDGCKDGWFWVGLGHDATWQLGLLKSSEQMIELARSSEVILIDIPIGLKEKGAEERLCDKQARKLLGPGRGSSVFPAPARSTLRAGSYEEAKRLNKECTGRGITLQAWGIIPKIREIDELILSNRDIQGAIRECHPEVCFWGLNGRKPVLSKKKKRLGREERLDILECYFPDARKLMDQAGKQYLRRKVAWDDIVDAMVNAVVAKQCREKPFTLPDVPQIDSKGLPMEMVYWVES